DSWATSRASSRSPVSATPSDTMTGYSRRKKASYASSWVLPVSPRCVCDIAPALNTRATPATGWVANEHPSRLPGFGEAEVDRGLGGVGPAAGHDLAARVEVDALGAVHVRVAEQARLPAAEAVVADRHRDRHVDADHPDLDVVLELTS